MTSVVKNGGLTGSQIGAIFSACPETGEIFWKRTERRGWIGRRAGVIKSGNRFDGGGYRIITVGSKPYRKYIYAHRLIWMWSTGDLPQGEIDHRNGNRDDNRIENLRDIPVHGNRKNRGKSRNNTSGYKWVSWNKRNGSWCASISGRKDGRRVTLYSSHHKTVEAAYEAACAAARRLHGEFYNSGS